MPKTICIIGAFDTKGEDHAFVRREIHRRGHQTLMVDIGVLGSSTWFPVDYEAEDVAKAGGFSLADLRTNKDKAAAMKSFNEAAPKLVLQLLREGRLDGIIGMGGSSGSAIIASAMFGNTTDCVNACAKILNAKGFEVLIFHATGAGGRAMETLVADGLVEAVLDITITEWADEICGGVSTRPGPFGCARRSRFAPSDCPGLCRHG
jgi:uncharacterized protein (UPF0261 family)